MEEQRPAKPSLAARLLKGGASIAGVSTSPLREARAATRDENWGPTGVQLNTLAQLTHEQDAAFTIFAVLEERLKAPGERWRTAYKALQVLEFLAKRGHERAITMALPLLPLLRCLNNFAFIGTDGKDYGMNVRIRSAAVVAVLEDLDTLAVTRQQLAERMARHYHEWVATPLSPTSPPTPQQQHVAGQTPTTNLKAAITADEAKRLAARLAVLSAVPANRVCADCASSDPSRRANWASVNCGVFLCVECAGLHRGLGTHVSQVRSVHLDTWLPAQVALMEAAGNGPANAYYEARLPPEQRPSKAAGAAVMAAFIRDKYSARRWADPERVWPPRCATRSRGATQSLDLGRVELPLASGRPRSACLSPTIPRGARPATIAALTGPATSPALTAIARHPLAQSSSPRAAPVSQPVQLDDASSPASSAATGVLLPLSDDDDDPMSMSNLLARPSAAYGAGPQGGDVMLDPSMGVLEWLDAQYKAGHGAGLPFSTSVLAGPQTPASTPSPVAQLSTASFSGPAGSGSPVGHMTHVLLAAAGQPTWVPGYVPPRGSHPATPLSTPFNRSAAFQSGALLATPGRTTSLPGAGTPVVGGPAVLPPYVLGAAVQHAMSAGAHPSVPTFWPASTHPHDVRSPYVHHQHAAQQQALAAARRAAFKATWDAIDDGTVADALDELAAAVESAGGSARVTATGAPAPVAPPPQTAQLVSPPRPFGSDLLADEVLVSSAGPLSAPVPSTSNGCAGAAHAQGADPLDALPPTQPPRDMPAVFRGDDPFRASVLPLIAAGQGSHPGSPLLSATTKGTAIGCRKSSVGLGGVVPACRTGSITDSPRTHSWLRPATAAQALSSAASPAHSLDDLVHSQLSELDNVLRPGSSTSSCAASPTSSSLAPSVGEAARSRLAAAGVVKPVSLPASAPTIIAPPIGQTARMHGLREGALAQAIVKGRWQPDANGGMGL